MLEIIKGIDPKQLEPIFHSEISSSRLLGKILKEYPSICKSFIEYFLGYKVIINPYVKNEYPIKKEGSIDIYLEFKTKESDHVLIIEVKVHDFKSATRNQLKTYFNATIKDSPKKIINVIYLTQFSRSNFSKISKMPLPPSIKEYERFISDRKNYVNNFRHVNWQEVYMFLNKHIKLLSATYKFAINLQQIWMLDYISSIIVDKTVTLKNRSINQYFNVNFDLIKELPFGEEIFKKSRTDYLINLKELNATQLESITNVIEKLINSNSIDRSYKPNNNWNNSKGKSISAKDFLIKLAQNPKNLKLLSFYSRLFSVVLSYKYVELNGTGKNGYSLLVKTDMGHVSLCTLWTNRQTIEFGLLR